MKQTNESTRVDLRTAAQGFTLPASELNLTRRRGLSPRTVSWAAWGIQALVLAGLIVFAFGRPGVSPDELGPQLDAALSAMQQGQPAAAARVQALRSQADARWNQQATLSNPAQRALWSRSQASFDFLNKNQATIASIETNRAQLNTGLPQVGGWVREASVGPAQPMGGALSSSAQAIGAAIGAWDAVDTAQSTRAAQVLSQQGLALRQAASQARATAATLPAAQVQALQNLNDLGAQAMVLGGSAGAQGLIAAQAQQAREGLLALNPIAPNTSRLWIAGLSLLALVISGAALWSASKGTSAHDDPEREARTREVETRNQEVMTLLEEIAPLSQGDLTIRVRDSSPFTEQIAQAVNFSTSELRALIMRVRAMSSEVGASTSQADAIAADMLQAARSQGDKLAETHERAQDVGESMRLIGESAKNAVEMAKASQQSALRGSQIADQSQSGMDDVRLAIQETSKKIKLVGESSTAVSEAANLIGSLTKRIEILALNAAIQAAAAGEDGQGFAAIVEEVQSLAVSSSETTSRIEELVRNLQVDAKGAVDAMEQTTQDVVEGAKGAENTSLALKEISEMATQVAQSVGSMGESVRVEAQETQALAEEMDALRDQAREAMQHVETAREAVADAKLASEALEHSVAGFKV